MRLLPIATSYRPDIDGLRAVAVMSVLLYHAGFSFIGGGYVGVDIFFVISGFLITRLLVSEIENNNKLNLSKFYFRRLRRIFPALTFTLIFSSFYAFWILSPKMLDNYGATLVHSVLSVSNIYFYTQNGYFDAASEMNPLLHTWSLGVEEQFYLVWPFLLLLVTVKKRLAPFFIVLIGLVSVFFAQNWVVSHNSVVFYLMPFRIFEFSIGASLVWFMGVQSKSEVLKNLIFLIGLTFIAYSVFGYTTQTSFPGFTALLPCIGAAFCIYSGDAKYAGKLLCNRFLVGVGLISYSLYLAHWPILVFYKNHLGGRGLSSVEGLLAIIASFVFAIFMYFFIEKPFRKIKENSAKFLLVSVMISFVLLYIGASMWALSGWGWRSWATTSSMSNEALKKGKESRFKTVIRICEQKGWASCDSVVKGDINALIMGDSHAPDALNAFERIYPKQNFVMSTLGGCPPYRDIEKITPPNHPDRLKCVALNKIRYDVTYLKQFDYIVINVLFQWYKLEYLYEYLEYLKVNNIKKVIVLGDYLTLERDMYELLNEYGYNDAAIRKWIAKTPVDESALKEHVDSMGYYFLSKRESLCEGNICKIFDENNVPFTYDEHHLSYEFSTRLALKQREAISQYLGLTGSELNNSKQDQFKNSPSLSKAKITIGSWGPKFTKAGVTPNVQPAGGMGVWIEVSNIHGLGDVKVFFGGKPALKTFVQEKLITAEVPASMLSRPGKYDIEIRVAADNRSIPVGFFEVQ